MDESSSKYPYRMVYIIKSPAGTGRRNTEYRVALLKKEDIEMLRPEGSLDPQIVRRCFPVESIDAEDHAFAKAAEIVGQFKGNVGVGIKLIECLTPFAFACFTVIMGSLPPPS